MVDFVLVQEMENPSKHREHAIVVTLTAGG